MSSRRTANWVSRTTPGAPPPPPSRPPTAPPPTIYPESSVSNPYASRYTGRPSRPGSSAHSHGRSRSAGPVSHHSGSTHRSRPSSAYHTQQPVQTFRAPPQEPIIARTSSASGRTSSYMIIPAHGQKVEILHPTPTSSSPSYTVASSHKDRPLIRRLFDKVEWHGSSAGKTSASRPVTHVSRRHSTGGNTIITSSGTRITNGSSRTYEVHYV